jgi:hypothetical protein
VTPHGKALARTNPTHFVIVRVAGGAPNQVVHKVYLSETGKLSDLKLKPGQEVRRIIPIANILEYLHPGIRAKALKAIYDFYNGSLKPKLHPGVQENSFEANYRFYDGNLRSSKSFGDGYFGYIKHGITKRNGRLIAESTNYAPKPVDIENFSRDTSGLAPIIEWHILQLLPEVTHCVSTRKPSQKRIDSLTRRFKEIGIPFKTEKFYKKEEWQRALLVQIEPPKA